MDIKTKAVNSAKKLFNSVKIANIHPSGMLATRIFILLILSVVIIITTLYIISFIKGYVSQDYAFMIDLGIKIVDHIYAVPAVLISVKLLFEFFRDKNNNDISDVLEENNNNENIH